MIEKIDTFQFVLRDKIKLGKNWVSCTKNKSMKTALRDKFVKLSLGLTEMKKSFENFIFFFRNYSNLFIFFFTFLHHKLIGLTFHNTLIMSGGVIVSKEAPKDQSIFFKEWLVIGPFFYYPGKKDTV